MTATSTISAEELDRRFDNGEDLEEFFDMENPVVTRSDKSDRRVNFTMPEWLIGELDKQAKHLAISRQAVAVTWLAERAEKERERREAFA